MPNGGNQQPTPQGRAKKWIANARITASVVANVANPLAGPIADRVSGDSPKPTVEATQSVQEDAQQDWVRYERVRKERQAGDVPPTSGSKRQRNRGR